MIPEKDAKHEIPIQETCGCRNAHAAYVALATRRRLAARRLAAAERPEDGQR